MKNHGFLRVCAVSPRVYLGDIARNTAQIIHSIQNTDAQILLFPELCITGSSLGDLCTQSIVLQRCLDALRCIRDASADLEKIIVVGLPLLLADRLYNTAAVLCGGNILGIAVKTLQNEDNRCFTAEIAETEVMLMEEAVPATAALLLDCETFRLGVCLDKNIDPALLQAAHIVLQPSTEVSLVDGHQKRSTRLAQYSEEGVCALVYANAGFGESTSYHVYDGYCAVYERGACLAETARFEREGNSLLCDVDIEALAYQKRRLRRRRSLEAALSWGFSPKTYGNLLRPLSPTPFLREDETYLEDMAAMQAHALLSRLKKIHCQKSVLGLSGGLDSSVCLLASYLAYQRASMEVQDILPITMPGFGTGNQTKSNAADLLQTLGLQAINIDISQSVRQHFQDIGHDETLLDVTYENAQARERTQILMDYANKIGGIVLGTGDMSEIALGFCTYNGDHMSMYSMNSGIPKTALKPYLLYLAKQISPACEAVCACIVGTPISPELLPVQDGELQQRSEGILGSYELHDFFLYHFIEDGYGREKMLFTAKQVFRGRYAEAEIQNTLDTFFRRFFNQQFKRNCTADGIGIYQVGLSPHSAWKMPSDVYDSLWRAE